MITSKTTNSFLHLPLPTGVTNIKTVLYHYSRPTTRGHCLRVLWKDGTKEWIPLKDMKEGFPTETAEYAVDHNLSHILAFSWWVPQTFYQHEKIIFAIRHHVVKKTISIDIRLHLL